MYDMVELKMTVFILIIYRYLVIRLLYGSFRNENVQYNTTYTAATS